MTPKRVMDEVWLLRLFTALHLANAKGQSGTGSVEEKTAKKNSQKPMTEIYVENQVEGVATPDETMIRDETKATMEADLHRVELEIEPSRKKSTG